MNVLTEHIEITSFHLHSFCVRIHVPSESCFRSVSRFHPSFEVFFQPFQVCDWWTTRTNKQITVRRRTQSCTLHHFTFALPEMFEWPQLLMKRASLRTDEVHFVSFFFLFLEGVFLFALFVAASRPFRRIGLLRRDPLIRTRLDEHSSVAVWKSRSSSCPGTISSTRRCNRPECLPCVTMALWNRQSQTSEASITDSTIQPHSRESLDIKYQENARDSPWFPRRMWRSFTLCICTSIRSADRSVCQPFCTRIHLSTEFFGWKSPRRGHRRRPTATYSLYTAALDGIWLILSVKMHYSPVTHNDSCSFPKECFS